MTTRTLYCLRANRLLSVGLTKVVAWRKLDYVKQQRFILLDGLRGIAAIGVVFHHIGKGAYPALNSSYLLVDFFFVLSGFVLFPMMPSGTISFKQESRAFVWRRFLRFWPMVILVVLFRLGLWGLWELRGEPDPIAGRTAHITGFPTTFIAALLLLHLLVATASEWSGVLWSLSAEWWANLIAMPFTASRRKWTLVLGLAFGYAILMLGWVMHQPAIEGFRALGRAMIGFFLGLLMRKLFNNRQPTYSAGLLMSSIALIVIYYFINRQQAVGELFIVGPLFAFFIYQVAAIDQATLNRKFLQLSSFLGAMSFGIYAWHPNVQMLLSLLNIQLVSKQKVQNSIAALVVSGCLIVLVSIVFAFLVQKLIDKPLHRRFGAMRDNSGKTNEV